MISHTKDVEQLAQMAQKATGMFAEKEYVEGLQILSKMNARLQKCIVRQTDELGRPHAVVAALERFVPQCTVQVQNAVTADLEEWFLHAEKQGRIVGASVFEAAESARIRDTLRRTISWMEQNERAGGAPAEPGRSALRTSSRRVMLWRLDSVRMSRTPTESSERSRQTSASSATAGSSFDGNDLDILLNASVIEREGVNESAYGGTSLSSFSTAALLQFTQVYEHVSMREEAVSFYRAKRLPQCNLQTMTKYDLYDASEEGEFPRRCRALFESILGFFILESYVRRTANVVAEAELKNMWKVNSEQLAMVLRMHLDSGLEFRYPRLFLDIADCVILLASIISQDAFHVHGIDGEENDETSANASLLKVASRMQLPADNVLDVLLRRKTRIGVAIKTFLELELTKLSPCRTICAIFSLDQSFG